MSHRTFLVWNSFTLLTLLALGAVACGPASTGADDAQVSATGGNRQFIPWAGEESLALSSPFPRFIFLPLNNPGVVPVDLATHMNPEDVVAGIVVNGQPRAYPLWIAGQFHVVNDTINDAPVILTYCEICSGASAFKPVIEQFGDLTLSFQIHGIARGTFTVYDYQTQTVWSPFTGRTLEGKLHPSRMERIPLIMEYWEDWVKRHPETEVLFQSPKFREREHMSVVQAQMGHEYIPQGFKDVGNMDDTRLAHNAFVFGVTNQAGDKSIAFPLDFLEEKQEVLRYPFANEHYLLKKIGKFGVVAYRLQKDQVDQTYHQVSQDPFRVADNEGGLWDEFGKALNESGEKRNLAVADGYFTEWYEWVSGYPESEIAN
jgi:hypothetical protein